MSGRALAGLLLALTAVRLGVAAWLPVTPDEAYYWVWSRALAPGYFDHPPMVALWIRAGTWIAGSTPLGIRLLGPFAALGGSALLYRAASDLAGPSAGWRAVLLLNATLLFGVGAATMTPDTPLLLFWTASLWAMARLIATGRPGWWLVVGAAVGAALCSKYTAALLPIGIGLWVLWAHGQARWLTRPWPWLGAAIAALLFAPVLWWNARHGWASFAKQGGRNAVFHPAQAVGHLGELLGGQAGLATPIVFGLCCVGGAVAVRRAWRQREPKVVLLACFTLPGAALFLEHALGDRVQANWPAILYPAAAAAACLLHGRGWQRARVAGIALGLALTALVYVQGVAAPLNLSRRLDPTLRLAGGYAGLAAELQALATQRHAAFIAADDYGPAALLALLGPRCVPTIAIEPRWALFDLPPGRDTLLGHTGLLLRSGRRRDGPSTQGWTRLSWIGRLARQRGGQIAELYDVYEGVGGPQAAAAALLPCGLGFD